jgi:hypothetical protein
VDICASHNKFVVYIAELSYTIADESEVFVMDNKIIYTSQNTLVDAILGNPPPSHKRYEQLPNGDTIIIDIEPRFEVINGDLCVVFDCSDTEKKAK